MSDAYQSALWDIEPYCQIAGICSEPGEDKSGILDDEVNKRLGCVILDGAYGASIRWKSFYRIEFTTGFSWKRWILIQIMENNTLLLSAASAMWGLVYHGKLGDHLGPICKGVAGLFYIMYLCVWVYTPYLVKETYGGKFKTVQAALFGVEGYLNAATVERIIFGGSFNRMRWSTNGSPLSRSYTNEFGERYGIDPTTDPGVRAKVEKARSAKPGEMRVGIYFH